MRLFDTSYYCDDDVLSNYLVEVLPVNKSVWLSFKVAKRFSLVLNSSNLMYKKAQDVSQLINLADGIYEIKQSVKPNIHTVVHFYHLRTATIKQKLRTERDKLFDDVCKLSKEEYKRNRDKLRDIDEYVDAAKYKVEECHDKEKGKELYDFASKLLETYTDECTCGR